MDWGTSLTQLESENLSFRDENQALIMASNKKHRFRAQIRPTPTLETLNSETGATLPPTKSQGDEATREKTKAKTESPMAAYQEHMLSKRLDAMQSMVERLPGVAPPIRKSNPQSYVDTPLTDEITLIEMPRKFSFPSIKAYDGTSDPDDHVANTDQELLDVKWKENVANRAKAQLKQDSKAVRPDRTLSKTSRGFREQKPGQIPEPRGQQDKWPQKIKAPDSFQNPDLWCVFHCDHGQKMEDSIALRIEVTKLLRKGPSDQRHIGRFENLRHKPRIHEEKHLERQTRPRGSQTEMPAPGHGLNILHSEEARKGSHPTS
ncbi:hypothetical protein F2Q70_00002789 [Brassica cretica]|uniref:Uncharacterized protein n=1 Tax=Brassica cretica TaxID=69181 RepID=A0A8S9IWB2_BRACR|nr:hypothetical protein F2Q70_00002789 [Brassica cretica]